MSLDQEKVQWEMRLFNLGFNVSRIQSPNKLIEKASITKNIAGKKVIHHSPENKKSFPNLIKVPSDGVVGGTPTPKKLNVDSAIIASDTCFFN